MKEILSIIAGILVLIGYIIYAKDILKGRAIPARSTRIMFVILLTITTLQLNDLNSGWLLALAVSELIGTIAILLLALRYGMGGITRIDIICYTLLIIDLLIWFSTENTLLALHLSVLADFIAFTPTLIKTWYQPWTETPLFFVFGAIAAPINIMAVGNYSYGVLLFPAYIAFGNILEITLIKWRQSIVPKPRHLTEIMHISPL